MIITFFLGYGILLIGAVIFLIIKAIRTNIKSSMNREDFIMEKTMRVKLLLYGLITAMSFSYLILPQNAGISVPIFIVLQFGCLLFILPSKKKLWLFIPIFILSLNSFISANEMWRVPNFIIILTLYLVMFIDIDIKETSLRFITNILKELIEPLNHINLPFKWLKVANKEKASIVKRVLIALIITIPVLLILTAVLSKIDMIFSKDAANFFKELSNFISFNVIFKIAYGIMVGIYLFGLIYSSHLKKETDKAIKSPRQGDLIILNILLISILAIYTLFVIIQFRYLFSGATQLPFGLNPTEYARRGFFELFALTGVNITIILMTVHLTKQMQTVWSKITKFLCCYFCAVTIVLLISSLMRMGIYNSADGLTRLRFMVFGFLFFEGIGLLITFFYIFKPKFNMVVIYLTIGLIYYVLLNVVPMDYFVAKSQIDRYEVGYSDSSGIPYALSLSADAAPQIERLLISDYDPFNVEIVDSAKEYFKDQHNYYSKITPRWQRYNRSVEYSEKVYRAILRSEAELSHIKTK